MRTKLIVICLAVSCFLVPRPYGGSESLVAAPSIQTSHPRLLVTVQSLPTVKARLGSGGAQAADFRAWLSWLDSQYGTPEATHELAMDFAFAWLTYPVAGASYGHTRDEYGVKARAILMAQIGQWPHDKAWGNPFAYDWLSASPSILSASDKTQLMEQFKTIDATDGAGTTVDNTPVNYVFNSFTPILRSQKMLYALASAGDGVDDAWASGVVDAFVRYFRDDRATTNLQRGVTWAQSAYGGADGGFAQGADYGYEYTFLPLVFAEEGYRTAMGISKAVHYGTSETNLFRYLPKFTAWFIIPDAFPRATNPALPDDYQWLFAKGHKQLYWEVPFPGDMKVRAALAAVRGLYDAIDPDMAGLARWLMAHRTGDLSPDPYGTSQRYYMVPVRFLIEGDATVAEKSPAEVNLGISAEHHQGWWTFRTSWDTNITDPYVMFSAQRKYAGLHSMTTNGDFQIYRKGPVVLRQGIGLHSFVGLSHAGAMMVFPDRTIQSSSPDDGSNLGASRWFFNPANNLGTDWAPNSEGDTGGETRFLPALGGASDVNYVLANLTKAYDHTIEGRTVSDRQGPRLANYVRQFVYFLPANPATESVRVVVFDRATVLDTKFEKNWRMPLAGEPQFANGTVSAGPSRGPDGTARKTHSTDTTILTATNKLYGADSKLWFTPLLPAARDVIKIGKAVRVGETPMFEDMYGKVFLDDQNPAGHEANSAPWRIEVVSNTGNLTDVFLNVIEVGDSAGNQSPTEPIRGGRFLGARVGNRVAVFAEFSERETNGFFVVPTAGSYKILVAGLQPGAEFDVLFGSSSQRLSATAAGTLYLDVTIPSNTTITLRPTGVVSSVPPVAPTNVRFVR